ncbi:MAG TPA: UDP-N-acetylmuramate--L-alanine ligase [Acidimicrobiales bacterium]|nr:UDP-N-acetylmuramate--L-alanine ligase [Acidimicrobiales bacterium]
MPDRELDLGRPMAVHIVAIGGAGMSAIATVLHGLGHRVTGSDLRPSPVLDRLAAMGMDAHVGHDAHHVGDVDLVTVSSAVPHDNPEVVEAERRGIPVWSRSRILTAITRLRRTVAVAGTHGKTTTSSMLYLVLREAGLAPSCIIGGDVKDIGTGAVWDTGDLLVVEADESDGTFVELSAAAAVVTSVEPDHLEHYGGFDALRATFARFVEQAGPVRVVCADDTDAAALAAATGAITYGTADGADFRITDLELGRTSSAFRVVRAGTDLGRVELPVAGLHNVRNAAAALATGVLLGAPFDAAVRALARYGGVARRFEFRGERDGVTFVDDYAHLPTEVASALAAARDGDWGRIVCVFQPHRFSRTASLAPEFAHAFDDADVVAVTEIYSHGELPRPGVSGKLVLYAAIDAHPGRRVAWLPTRADLVTFLRRELRPGDLCLTLGAGDLTTLPDELLAGGG